jgi:hypothetical protein
LKQNKSELQKWSKSRKEWKAVGRYWDFFCSERLVHLEIPHPFCARVQMLLTTSNLLQRHNLRVRICMKINEIRRNLSTVLCARCGLFVKSAYLVEMVGDKSLSGSGDNGRTATATVMHDITI